MENNIFQVPAMIQGISTLKDKTLKFTAYTTIELPAEDKAKILGLEQDEGWLVFSTREITEADIPDEKVPVKEQKTQAQRIRGVLYVLWEAKHPKKDIDFETFYKQQTERIIEWLKAKIDG